jgi:hypothetical protein
VLDTPVEILAIDHGENWASPVEHCHAQWPLQNAWRVMP